MAKDGITLRLKPQQGKTQTITSKANMMTMMEVQGQSMSMSQTMEIKQSFNATKVTETQSDIETQVEAIKMSISQMGMKLEYDSEHPEKTSPMLAGRVAEMEKYLKDTYGICVYQEQVMLLSRLLADFTRGESDSLRKAMGKKQIDKMEELYGKFMKQGVAKLTQTENLPEDEVKQRLEKI